MARYGVCLGTKKERLVLLGDEQTHQNTGINDPPIIIITEICVICGGKDRLSFKVRFVFL